MKIQFITYSGKEKLFTEQSVTESRFDSPQSFSEFDLNIISLQDEIIWRNKDYSSNYHRVDCNNHLLSLNSQIKNSSKNTIVFLPQNYIFSYGSKYDNRIHIKDILGPIFDSVLERTILSLPSKNCSLVFENCKTVINGKSVNSAFVFDTYCDALTKSKSNNSKTTIIYANRCVLSGLDLSELNIDDFLSQIGLLNKAVAIPEWVKEYEFYNDNALIESLKNEKERLQTIKKTIDETNNSLKANLRYKSILVETGEPLVEICFELLEKMLNCNLSKFVDEKKADFIIPNESITFVGEIKGVNHNVNRGNISQVQRHCADYLDELDENGIVENVKGILIIAHQREKALCEREPVHTNIIEDAKKNNILIITTDVFLKLFEKYLNGMITVDEVVDLFSNKTGLLTFE